MSNKGRVATAIFVAALLAVAGQTSAQTGPAPQEFSWFSNGVQSATQQDRLAEARLALQNAHILRQGATWVCSPAGFGQPSRCYRG